MNSIWAKMTPFLTSSPSSINNTPTPEFSCLFETMCKSCVASLLKNQIKSLLAETMAKIATQQSASLVPHVTLSPSICTKIIIEMENIFRLSARGVCRCANYRIRYKILRSKNCGLRLNCHLLNVGGNWAVCERVAKSWKERNRNKEWTLEKKGNKISKVMQRNWRLVNRPPFYTSRAEFFLILLQSIFSW